MLKNSMPSGTSAVTGNVASTTGTAPRRPAQPEQRAARASVKPGAERDERGQRPGDHHDDEGDRRALERDVAELRGEHEQPEHEEHGELGQPAPCPSWKVTIVRLAGIWARAERQPGQVDGEEAGAVQRVGGAEGQRGGGQRGDRVQAGGGQPQRARAPTPRRRPTASADAERRCPSPGRTAASMSADRRSRASRSTSMKPSTSRTATGSLKPASPSSVRASRRRSVDPRSTANTAAPSVAATIEPSSSALERARSRIATAAARPVSSRGGERADDRERERRRAAPGGSRRTRWPGRPRTGSAPGRRCRPCGRARSRRSRSSPGRRSRQHPEPEEQHEAGERGGGPAAAMRRARGEQGADDQDRAGRRPIVRPQPCQTAAPDADPQPAPPRRRPLRAAARSAAAAGDELVEWTPARRRADARPRCRVRRDGGVRRRDERDRPGAPPVADRRDRAAPRRARAGMPVLGVCLGAQLLAAAGGAEVLRVDEPEIGLFDVERGPAAPGSGARRAARAVHGLPVALARVRAARRRRASSPAAPCARRRSGSAGAPGACSSTPR